MQRRVLALVRARLAMQGSELGLPWAALIYQASFACALCALVRGALPSYAYALFALALAGAQAALVLLGDSAWLRADPAREWIAAQPVRARELEWARLLHLVLLLGLLALATLLPAALLAPHSFELPARVLLIGAGLGELLLLAALLLALQSMLGARAGALLVLLHAAALSALVLGALRGLRELPSLAELHRAADTPLARWSPPGLFAAPFGTDGAGLLAALLAAAGALVLLALLPLVPVEAARRGPALSERALAPLERLGLWWCLPAERGGFQLAWSALPREREFAMRTWPLLALPIGLLLAAAAHETGAQRAPWLALVLFSAPVYFPVLLVQVSASASHAARWLLDGAIVSRAATAGGVYKALALRFVLPLYLVLMLGCGFALSWWEALRLGLPALLLALFLLRAQYAHFSQEPPLSHPPGEVRGSFDAGGGLIALGFVLAITAVLVQRYADGLPALALMAAALLFGLGLQARHAQT